MYLEVDTSRPLDALETSDGDVLLVAQPEPDDVQHHYPRCRWQELESLVSSPLPKW